MNMRIIVHIFQILEGEKSKIFEILNLSFIRSKDNRKKVPISKKDLLDLIKKYQ